MSELWQWLNTVRYTPGDVMLGVFVASVMQAVWSHFVGKSRRERARLELKRKVMAICVGAHAPKPPGHL